MMGCPVSDEEANRMLKLWGLANRVGGPKAYPKASAHVPVARGKALEWTDHKVELVGWVVQQLDDDERMIVKLYFEPQADGKRLKVNAIRKKTSIHSDKINRALDRCIGRVAGALSMPQWFNIENNA